MKREFLFRSMPVVFLSVAMLWGVPLQAQSTLSAQEYFGMEPPGPVPEVFSPAVISESGLRLHSSIVLSPDLQHVVWSVIPPAVLSRSYSNGTLTAAAPMELQGRAVQAPAFSADGTRLYYQAVLEGGEGGLDIWWVEQSHEGWGPPVNLGPPVNTDRLESQPSLTSDGVLYFTGELAGAGLDRGIYRSRPIDGGYGPPELLVDGINSEYIDYCPWIARDESYLLFASSRPEMEEHLHLFVAFRRKDGSWSEPRNIHEAIAFEGEARFPSVSPDGRLLFFISGGLPYWVDMAPVLALKPGEDRR